MARHLQGSMADRLLDSEFDLITQVVAEYRRGDLTAERVYGVIGEIAALRRLADSLETDIRRGDATAEEEYKHGEEVSS